MWVGTFLISNFLLLTSHFLLLTSNFLLLTSNFLLRAVIRYLYLKGKTGKKIHGELADVYGSSAPSYAQVKF